MYYQEAKKSLNELRQHLQKGEELASVYDKKRKGYLDSIKDEQNETLNERLLLAAISTRVCAHAFLDYLVILTNNLAELSEKFESHNAVISDVDKALFATVESTRTRIFSAQKESSDAVLALKADVDSVVSAIQGRIAMSDQIENGMLFKLYVLNITTVYIYSTLIELLKTEDSKVALEVLMVLLKFSKSQIAVIGR